MSNCYNAPAAIIIIVIIMFSIDKQHRFYEPCPCPAGSMMQKKVEKIYQSDGNIRIYNVMKNEKNLIALSNRICCQSTYNVQSPSHYKIYIDPLLQPYLYKYLL